jgi:hypothetical protein
MFTSRRFKQFRIPFFQVTGMPVKTKIPGPLPRIAGADNGPEIITIRIAGVENESKAACTAIAST